MNIKNPNVSVSVGEICEGQKVRDIFNKIEEIIKIEDKNYHKFKIETEKIEKLGKMTVEGSCKSGYRCIENLISGIISINISGDYGDQHFFWSYTCLEDRTQSLTFNFGKNIAIEVQVNNSNY